MRKSLMRVWMRVDFRGKYGNCWKYRGIFQNYPEGFSKNEKLILRKFCKNFEYDDQTDCLFYIDKRRDGSTLKRLVIKEEEKSRVFEEATPLIFLAMQAETIPSERSSSVTTGQIITMLQLKW